MSVRSGQSITALFTTRSPATGAATNATGTPTGTLYVNGVSNAASVTVANLATGIYTAAVTLPTLAVSDLVEIIINATVGGVTDNGIIWSDTKDILLDSSGDVTFNNTTIATVTTVTNQLTLAAIATGIFQDTTAGDFTVAGSIGKSLFTSGNAPGAASGLALVGSNVGTATSVSGAVGSVTAGVTVTTNNDKTGYSLTQAFPTNFSALGITVGGHISNVDTLTTYTGNTLQTGDSFARLGVAGVGLTNLGDTRIAHLDADVSSRMATYTQPTGFLAAAFPATVASPTNITAGTITTVTTLTNLPAIPANWLTAAGIAASALNGKGDWLLASSYTAPLSASGTRSAVGMASANLDAQLAALDTDILTRLATSAYTAPDNADIIAIKAKTDNLPASPAAVGSAMTLAAASITTAAIANGAITDAKFTVPAVTGVETGILGMIAQTWRRFFAKSVKDDTAKTLTTFADDGTTVLTTQGYVVSGNDEQVNAAI